jgi:hypothetical protein
VLWSIGSVAMACRVIAPTMNCKGCVTCVTTSGGLYVGPASQSACISLDNSTWECLALTHHSIASIAL